MGFSSRICKHCGHSILSHHSVDAGINDWMKDVVVLQANGTRLIGEHNGYLSIDCEFADEVGPIYGGVWVHEACWEVAGKPSYDTYDGPSDDASDQGYCFEDGDHDMIDPRVTDEAERERLLEKGRAARAKRRYDDAALKVYRWLHTGWSWEEERGEPWRHRFGYDYTSHHDENGEIVCDETGKAERDPGHWRVKDDLYLCDGEIFEGTQDECEACLAAKWEHFIESDECKAYLARFEEMQEEERRERDAATCSA